MGQGLSAQFSCSLALVEFPEILFILACTPDSQYRAPVSMGAVGASAPMLFKVVGASTHTFWQLFLLSYSYEI